MGKVLDQLVESRVATFESSYKSNNVCNDEMFQQAKDALISDIKKNVRDEIVSEFTEAEKARIDKKVREHKTKKDLESLRTLVLESILLAIVVGVIVNQITDIITHLKDGNYAVAWTVGIILFLGLGVWGFVLFRLASVVGALLGNKENDNENNP